ncbi:MAG: TonB-dependent receptor [Gemmatimonadetes bacterium]|nr:TonB-dependent receptor [Gemmatimonadota bacterium]MDA1104302.1 TonB-dependent receptor [Gemmatimonadota bacterium]
MRMRLFGSTLAAAAALFVFSGSLTAQQGTLIGTVTNEAGATVDQAQIEVRGGAPNTGTLSDAQGRYRIALPAGSYDLIVRRVGSRTTLFENVTVRSGQTTTFDIVLSSQAEILDAVVVTASRGTGEKSTEAPATTHTISSVEIEERPVQSVVDHLRSSPGVNIISQGVQASNVVVRGFSNIFSGALHVLTDHRLAGVPSLRVNLMHFIPSNEMDLERIEVVLGPGSALYGPNTANGVVHLLTKSPLDDQGTSVTFGAGERSVYQGSFRSSHLLGNNFGVKLSGQYLQGNEWEYEDATELAARARADTSPAACLADKAIRGHDAATAQTACGRLGLRDYDIERYGFEARADWRFADDGVFVATYGRNNSSGIELTGLGAGQTIDWIYEFYQARVSKNRFFAQAYYNTSDAGQSYLIREGVPLIDRSTLFVAQAQQGVAFMDGRQDFTFGVDYYATRPETGGSINGLYESVDEMNEWGVYLQSKTALTDQVDFIAAGRIDSHSLLPENVMSPRAAVVFRPTEEQSLRFTYNRAFSTPSSLNYFLDISGGAAPGGLGPLGYTTRAFGTGPNGFGFQNDDGTLRGVRSPFNPLGPGNLMAGPSVPIFWGGAVAVLSAQVAANPALAALGPLLPILSALSPTNADLGVMLLDPISLTVQPLGPNKVIPDVPTIRESYTESFEVGWTGILDGRLKISADAYYMKKNDFVSPLLIMTPLLTLNGADIASFITGPIVGALTAQFIAGGMDPAVAAATAAATAAAAVPQIAAGMAGIPVGVVSSSEVAAQGSDLIVSYRNVGDLNLWGADLALQWFLTDEWSLTGAYSHISDDYFDADDGAPYAVALNAPRSSGNLGLAYRNVESGFTATGRVRFSNEFPAISADFVGTSCVTGGATGGLESMCVEAFQIVDVSLGYKVPNTAATLQVAVNNVFNADYRSFVGVPTIGRFAMVRVRYDLF